VLAPEWASGYLTVVTHCLCAVMATESEGLASQALCISGGEAPTHVKRIRSMQPSSQKVAGQLLKGVAADDVVVPAATLFG